MTTPHRKPRSLAGIIVFFGNKVAAATMRML